VDLVISLFYENRLSCNNSSNEKNKQEQSQQQSDKQQLSTKEKIEHLQQNLIVPSSINSMIIKAKLAILV